MEKFVDTLKREVELFRIKQTFLLTEKDIEFEYHWVREKLISLAETGQTYADIDYVCSFSKDYAYNEKNLLI